MYDVIIIGAGVTGSAIARELSRYERKVAVLERASDVCEGTSKANSGIVHAGYDAEPGTLKAKLNVMGNEMMGELARELDIPFKRNGSMVLMFEEEDREALEALYEKGCANGVKNLRIIGPEEIHRIEPAVTEHVAGALYAPDGGIVCPFHLTMALAENACDNGVEFHLNTEVKNIRRQVTEKGDGSYCVETTKGDFEGTVVINAAGVYADVIHNMVSGHRMQLTPRRGEYCLMDKTEGSLVTSTVFQLPSRMGKGILVTPTVHGNLLVGPTAEDIEDKEGVNTTAAGLAAALEMGRRSVESLSPRKVITSFAGLRAHHDSGDFVIREAEDAPGFIDVAGIESPGLSCAPAIGLYVAEMTDRISPAPLKKEFQASRKGIPNMALATEEERQALIAQNPAFANVICRCELVTEGEILAAIHRTLGAVTLDGIKRRTRAGMGRCQAGFCSPRTVEILARELGTDMEEITKAGGASGFLKGHNKEVRRDEQ